MSDAQLEAKFRAQCDPVIGAARSAGAVARWWGVDTLARVDEGMAACVPEAGA
jgi:hypothetical protein